jgi:hypothetical protein
MLTPPRSPATRLRRPHSRNTRCAIASWSGRVFDVRTLVERTPDSAEATSAPQRFAQQIVKIVRSGRNERKRIKSPT